MRSYPQERIDIDNLGAIVSKNFQWHQIGDTEIETINANYVSDLLSREWGFYYTVTANLEKIEKSLSDYTVLADIDREDISAKIDRLRDVIESKPSPCVGKCERELGPAVNGATRSKRSLDR